MIEYAAEAVIQQWTATDSRLEVSVYFKPPGVRNSYTRVHTSPAYGARNKWLWYKCTLEDSFADRSPVRAYDNGSEAGVPAILDLLVLSHEQLRIIAKFYGYDPNDTEVKEQLEKVLQKSAS